MRILARLLLATSLLFALAGCPPRAVRVDGRSMPVDEAARYELENARARVSAGDPAGAAELFETVARRYADSTEADEALFEAGKAWEAARQPIRARAAYEMLLSRYPRSDKAAEARARVEALGGGRDEALARAREAYDSLPEGQKFAAARRNAADAEAAGNGRAAFHWREQALLRAPDLRSRQQAEADLERILEVMAPIEVETLEVERRSPAAPFVAWRQAQLHQQARDWEALEESLSRFLAAWPDHARAGEARALLQKIERRGAVVPNRIGVALPLSGSYRVFGEQLRAGIEHALRGARVELVFRDTRGEAEGATAAIERLLYEDHVIVAIGGVITAEAQAAAEAADELGLPFISFSRTESFPAQSEWVFRDMLTNSAIADALVAYAMDQRGLRDFAVLHPQIQYGEEMRDLFGQRVEAKGGRIAGIQSYPQESTTFSEPIRTLVKRDDVVNRPEYQRKLAELRAQGIQDARKRRAAIEKIKASISPVIDFQALFVPDQWKTVALVAPALAFEDVITNWCDESDIRRIERTTGQKVKPVMLLGGNLWNHRDLPARAGKYINCSIFVDGFHAGSSRPETARFVESFRAATGRTPGLLEAYGSEAAVLAGAVIANHRPESRRAFRDALLGQQELAGPMGPITVTEEREIVHPLFLLTVDRGVIREVEEVRAEKAALGANQGAF